MTRLACRCMGLSSRRIEAVVRERQIRELDALAEATGAGGGCGTCRPELAEIVADVLGEPVLEATRRANRARNAAETLRRVETALFGSIAARLPAAARLELISVDGLRVELHLAGKDAPELRALVAERLCKLV
ncbi:MAG TPA: (2Fe-2S)-binding protein, partial [Myxococcota bacterium]|nr:(2Fe-2S)-binding protein [Myxococcota bacterium]